jgi:hypothetical protein
VPRRRGGGESPLGSVEAGLRDLARDSGPNIRELSRGRTENLRGIMRAAQTPADWPEDAKAAAVLTVIQEQILDIANPRWKAAAQAAFRMPAEQYVNPGHDSLAGRWRALADRSPGSSRNTASSPGDIKDRAEALRGYWVIGAGHLAERVELRFMELNNTPDGWLAYRRGAPSSPPQALPVSFERTDVLYRFNGRLGVEALSYRWLIANAPVDRYEPVGWYYNEPDAPVEIIPLANCSTEGALRDLP